MKIKMTVAEVLAKELEELEFLLGKVMYDGECLLNDSPTQALEIFRTGKSEALFVDNSGRLCFVVAEENGMVTGYSWDYYPRNSE
jgi:hypothetical protein